MRLVGAPCLALLLASALGGCAPRGEVGVASAATATIPVAAPAPIAAKPSPPAAAPTAAPSSPAAPTDDLLACAADTDCAVKDVGSCCGARPACVRADAKTFPEQVKARCAAEGRMSTCGFTSIEGCVCQQGRCAPVVAAPAPASPQPLQ